MKCNAKVVIIWNSRNWLLELKYEKKNDKSKKLNKRQSKEYLEKKKKKEWERKNWGERNQGKKEKWRKIKKIYEKWKNRKNQNWKRSERETEGKRRLR